MAIEIKSWRDGKVPYTAKTANDVRTAVEEAVREGADLRYADLRYADLGYADLRYAKGLAVERVNDLLLLFDQVGKIRAYKLVDENLRSPIQSSGKLTYEIGSTVEAEANDDPDTQCGAGINLATLPWCLQNYRPGNRVLICEFTAKDIAAIPVGDGKFRVHKAKVVKEVDLEPIFAKEQAEVPE